MYQRLLKNQIKKDFLKGKVIIISGARQTGKTTLALDVIQNQGKTKIFNCDNPSDREILSGKDLEFLIKLVGEANIILIDEGQKVENLGQTLKLLVDYYKNKKQIIVTGSSSFNLLDQTQEALTGRKFVHYLFPLSLEELYPDKDLLKISKELEALLVFGSYPEISNQNSFAEKENRLRNLAESYLYKDILQFQQIKNASLIGNLLKALALQIGGEVSYNELSNLLSVDKKTVERYINILEKNYIIFRLPPFSKNKRKEISKLKKIYFYDLGIRNAIINNFNFLSSRSDAGALWENFILAERLKFQKYHQLHSNNYFWRTYEGAKIDLIEEREGKLFGYEFKWNDRKAKNKAPKEWQKYTQASYEIITPKEIGGFVI
jgi:uncharacterized protein